mmetsp:Transcript_43192/g.133669  ORF Transcript_43192/g.133669 Transcript_43192/m.133669 type:complete len:216 (-) Transcript_43192:1508-2155(-)
MLRPPTIASLDNESTRQPSLRPAKGGCSSAGTLAAGLGTAPVHGPPAAACPAALREAGALARRTERGNSSSCGGGKGAIPAQRRAGAGVALVTTRNGGIASLLLLPSPAANGCGANVEGPRLSSPEPGCCHEHLLAPAVVCPRPIGPTATPPKAAEVCEAKVLEKLPRRRANAADGATGHGINGEVARMHAVPLHTGAVQPTGLPPMAAWLLSPS